MEDRPYLNEFAIVSLILGLAAVFLIVIGTFTRGNVLVCFAALAVGPIAAIAGLVGSKQIRGSEGRQRDSRIALAGTVLGVISPLLFLAVWIYFVFTVSS